MRRLDVTRRGFVIGGLAAGSLLASPGLALAQPGADAAVHAGRRTTRATTAAEGGPDIVDCAGWGARPNSAVVPVWNQRPVQRVSSQHTGTPN